MTRKAQMAVVLLQDHAPLSCEAAARLMWRYDMTHRNVAKWRRSVRRLLAREMLRVATVSERIEADDAFDQNETSTRRHVPIVSFYDDPAVHVRPEPRRGFSLGERRLAQALIEDALREASLPPSQMRDDARAWLRDLGISAKACFEALDVDYDAAMGRLEKLWVAWDADPASRIRRRKRPRKAGI